MILDIDGPVPLGDVVRIYDACQSANFRQVSFAMKFRCEDGRLCENE